MRILIVDELASADGKALLAFVRAQPQVEHVVGVDNPADALGVLRRRWADVLLVNTAITGAAGLRLTRSGQPPVVVFLAEEDHSAVAMSDAGAIATLRKPVRQDRLTTVLNMAATMLRGLHAGPSVAEAPDELPVLAVEGHRGTVFVERADVHIVEAHGNGVRLHTVAGTYELRMSLSALEEHWTGCGFLRVHRSYLLALDAVRQLRNDIIGAELIACTDAGEARVSRRNAARLRRALRDNQRSPARSRQHA